MNSLQESKGSMYLAMQDFLAANASILEPLPNYLALSASFLSLLEQLQTYGERQQFDHKGITATKGSHKKVLVLLTADASRKLTAYAKFANDQVLLNETKLTESDLNRLADTTLRDSAQGIYDRAQSNLTALASYGVTTETQSALHNAIAAFATAIPKPRLGITDKKQITDQLADLFKQADDALESIDILVEIVRMAQPNFYKGYKAARKIVETGTGSLAVKGMITDAVSGEAVKNARILFEMSSSGTNLKMGKATQPIEKKSAEKGGFNIKTLATGVYSVTIQKIGYAAQVVNLAVTEGETAVLSIKLIKQ